MQEPLLAHSFLRELRRGGNAPGGVAAWGARLAAALLVTGARSGNSGEDAQARVAEQVASLGRALFLDRQLPALLPLLRLAGAAAEEPGLQFLQVGSRHAAHLHAMCAQLMSGALMP